MITKGWRKRHFVTEVGDVQVMREYFYCPDCHHGVCPVDERWEVTQSVYSPTMRQTMVWVAATHTYDEAAETFLRLTHRAVPPTSIWEVTQMEGARLQAEQTRAQAATPPERLKLPPAGHDHAVPKAVSLDGGTLYVRGEGWKEFKVGSVGDIVVTPDLDPVTHDWEDRAHTVKVAYQAVLGDVAAFTPALWSLAVTTAVPTAATVAVTADGAEWIWNVVTDLFPDAVQIVDWYHATEYVGRAATTLFPTDETARAQWRQALRHPLFKGEAHKVIATLEAAGLTTPADYFRRHTRRMQYQTFREEGYPIGSGTVESGIKQFKHRLTGAGMRWSRAGAERMLVLRAAVLSHTFDGLWCKN